MTDKQEWGWKCSNGHVQTTPDPNRPGRCAVLGCRSSEFVHQPLRRPKRSW